MDGRCKTCQFWIVDETYTRGLMGICDCAEIEVQETGIGYDCGYLGGDIYTGPDFGCVHWLAIKEPSHA